MAVSELPNTAGVLAPIGILRSPAVGIILLAFLTVMVSLSSRSVAPREQ
ncbi:hypothetical protein [Halocatena halophila]